MVRCSDGSVATTKEEVQSWRLDDNGLSEDCKGDEEEEEREVKYKKLGWRISDIDKRKRESSGEL
ncbi:hypothetical protein HPP92_006735 [Vanilla planifolia]|uniref:Uncharacterized protein n=1 Tax=Vanilla planifolia TaxID=51239 RepID=A0A835RPY2_VANPL|nr:hypothetical protein HPP92_006735 [Vanilla planifolia]